MYLLNKSDINKFLDIVLLNLRIDKVKRVNILQSNVCSYLIIYFADKMSHKVTV